MAGIDTGAEDLSGLMEAIFNPKSVAVVGVPEGPKMGRLFLMGLVASGYKGKIYPVNPRADEIDGIKVIKRTKDIPEPIDLAIVLIPKKHLPGVIDELGEVGTKAAVIFTAGLAELGEEGAEEQRLLVERAREAGIRLIGPNCQGVYSPEAGISFFPGMPTTIGDVSFVAGSGSLASMTVWRAASRHLYFNKVISFGNACDLTPSDFASYFAGDDETKVIISYIEGIPEGRRFFETLKGITPKKPVVVWKAGLTDLGAKAARSHTGALSGSAELWEAALRQLGAVTAQGMDGIVDAMMALKFIPYPIGNRVAILSGPGGLAVSAADIVAREGLTLADLTEETKRKIAKVIPGEGTSVKNPVDVGLGASGISEQYTLPARYLLEDPNVDSVVIIGGTFYREMNEVYRRELITAKNDTNKSLIAVTLEEFTKNVGDDRMDAEFIEGGVPTFPSPERALSALKKVYDYGEFLRAVGG
jgi:acyl-CoA synthetase (NDP forming)